MSKELPPRADLEHLKKQAKRLLSEFRQGSANAATRFRALASPPQPTSAKLADAQHIIAREYGFANWAALKEQVESAARDADPWLALEAALRENSTDGVRRVLDANPALRKRLNDALPNYGFGATPLIAASHYRNRDTIELLLAAGADINQRSHWWAGSFGVLDDDRGLADFYIARGARVDANAAAKLGMLDQLKEMVERDSAVVHARGGDGQTPLHVAQTVEVAQFLLDHGAEIDALDVDHESTPAQYLIREHQDVVRLLIERGCRTDILMAAALGDLALVRKHLDANPASIRTTVDRTWFPMRNERAGGTIYIWTLGGNATPHTVARAFKHEDVLRMLMDASPAEVKLAQACELGDEPLFKSLLAARPNLAETLTDEERRKLVKAAENNNTSAVRLMLEAGWPVDVRGPGGETALHFAAWHGNVAMVRDILQYNPPLEIKDKSNGVTPINWAVHGSEHGWHKESGDYGTVVEALLDAGATPPKISDDLEGGDAIHQVLARRGIRP